MITYVILYFVIGMMFSQIFNCFSDAGEPALIWVVAFIWLLIVLSIPFCVVYDWIKKLKKI